MPYPKKFSKEELSKMKDRKKGVKRTPAKKAVARKAYKKK